MKVLEFAFDSRDTGSASDYLPHNYSVNSVAYTGTHDNETLAGMVSATITAAGAQLWCASYLNDYATRRKNSSTGSMVCTGTAQRGCQLCVIPMQDWLGLDNSAPHQQTFYGW